MHNLLIVLGLLYTPPSGSFVLHRANSRETIPHAINKDFDVINSYKEAQIALNKASLAFVAKKQYGPGSILSAEIIYDNDDLTQKKIAQSGKIGYSPSHYNSKNNERSKINDIKVNLAEYIQDVYTQEILRNHDEKQLFDLLFNIPPALRNDHVTSSTIHYGMSSSEKIKYFFKKNEKNEYSKNASRVLDNLKKIACARLALQTGSLENLIQNPDFVHELDKILPPIYHQTEKLVTTGQETITLVAQALIDQQYSHAKKSKILPGDRIEEIIERSLKR